MTSIPFGQPGNFWRGNLHTHTNVSDGMRTPAEACRLYREAGYDFVSLTEHLLEIYNFPVIDSTQFRTDDFTTLIGAEMHGVQTEMGSPWHIVANGLPLDFSVSPSDSGPELARRAMAAGAFVTVAHPQWYTLTEFDVFSLDDFHAIEIFNGVAADHNDRPDSWYMADVVLGRGVRCHVTAADDFHGFPNSWDFQRGWVWVKAEELTPEALLAALKAGHFYSSTGPRIYDVTVTASRQLSVRCSHAERIFVTGMGPAAMSAGHRGITSADFYLTKFDSPYCRITVRDAYGLRAWTNPIWFDTL